MKPRTTSIRSGYVIRIHGHLSPVLSDWLGGLEYENLAEGDALLFLPFTDQAALYGLLNRLRDAGLKLISIVPAE